MTIRIDVDVSPPQVPSKRKECTAAVPSPMTSGQCSYSSFEMRDALTAFALAYPGEKFIVVNDDDAEFSKMVSTK